MSYIKNDFLIWLRRLTHKHHLTGLICCLLVVGLGVYTFGFSHAASPYASTMTAKGQLGAGASIKSDPSADGGQAVVFGGDALQVRVVANQLVSGSGQTIRLLGVDATGTEDACIEDKGFSFGPLSAEEAQAMASWHITAVRVPLNEDCWLGINNAPTAYAGAAYQAAIKSWVGQLNAVGIVAILDLHWAAPGTYQPLQQWPMADADHSITFWSQVASAYAQNPAVIYDLYNEPFIGYDTPSANDWQCWLHGCQTSFNQNTVGTPSSVSYETAGMQQMVSAVRAAGATQPIMVGGLNWAGDPCGLKDSDYDGSSCMWLSDEPTDPSNQLIASFHTYDWTACASVACYNADVVPVAASVPVITGEFGEKDCATSFNDSFMNWADAHDISYLAWSWQPPYPSETRCVGVTASNGNDISGTGINLELLQNYYGTPNTLAPEGADVQAHLAAEAAQ